MSAHPGMTTFHSARPTSAWQRLGILMQADANMNMTAAPCLFEASIDLFVQVTWNQNADSIMFRGVSGGYEPVVRDKHELWIEEKGLLETYFGARATKSCSGRSGCWAKPASRT